MYIINSARNCISSKRSFVYHHCESLWYTLKRDDIQSWRTDEIQQWQNCHCWWYTIAFAMDKKIDLLSQVDFLVGVTGLEPTTSSSQNWRATNCATPRKILNFYVFANLQRGVPFCSPSCGARNYFCLPCLKGGGPHQRWWDKKQSFYCKRYPWRVNFRKEYNTKKSPLCQGEITNKSIITSSAATNQRRAGHIHIYPHKSEWYSCSARNDVALSVKRCCTLGHKQKKKDTMKIVSFFSVSRVRKRTGQKPRIYIMVL